MKERKLTNFFCSREGNRDEIYHISFAYYEAGRWTGESEEVELSEERLYEILKPALMVHFYTEKAT